jgi:hypothetical protein
MPCLSIKYISKDKRTCKSLLWNGWQICAPTSPPGVGRYCVAKVSETLLGTIVELVILTSMRNKKKRNSDLNCGTCFGGRPYYKKQNDIENAIKFFDRTAAVNPDDAFLQSTMGAFFMNPGYLDRAAKK